MIPAHSSQRSCVRSGADACRCRAHTSATAATIEPRVSTCAAAEHRLGGGVGPREGHDLGGADRLPGGEDDRVGREQQHRAAARGTRSSDGDRRRAPASRQEVAGRVEQEQADEAGEQERARRARRTSRRGRCRGGRSPGCRRSSCRGRRRRSTPGRPRRGAGPPCPAGGRAARRRTRPPAAARAVRWRCRARSTRRPARHRWSTRSSHAAAATAASDATATATGSRSLLTRAVSPRGRPAVRGPRSLLAGTPRGDRRRDRSPCGPGRRDGEGSGVPQTAAPPPPPRTGVTTVTIQHSPAPARSDVATTAPARLDPRPPVPGPRPGAHRRRPRLGGDDGRRRHRPPGPRRGGGVLAVARACSRSVCSSCSAPCGAPRPSARVVWPAPSSASRRSPSGSPSARPPATASGLTDFDKVGVRRPRRLLAPVDARHVPHRHPDRDRRPLEGRHPLLADGRRELGRRHHPRDGASSATRSATSWPALHLVVGYAVLGVLVSRKRD